MRAPRVIVNLLGDAFCVTARSCVDIERIRVVRGQRERPAPLWRGRTGLKNVMPLVRHEVVRRAWAAGTGRGRGRRLIGAASATNNGDGSHPCPDRSCAGQETAAVAGSLPVVQVLHRRVPLDGIAVLASVWTGSPLQM